ncbi:MAG TPA: DEAD/DEAH box helicase family protein [Elusimicrobiota bacterium]|nr:DEAD/DEAH box helicase family protein [Elusimicrobiota bacterium]
METAPGVYLATHPWLDRPELGRLHKVGHTGDLGGRLHDGAYTTCFPPGWRYVATFELKTKDEAHLLESAVLHCCRHLRLGERELVRAEAPQLAALVERAAEALGLAPVRRDSPEYRPRRRAADAEGAAEHAEWPRRRPAVEGLTLPAPEAAPEPGPALEPELKLDEDLDLDALTEGLCDGLDLSEAAPPSAEPPALPPAEPLALRPAEPPALSAPPAGPPSLPGLDLRGYQREAVERCEDELRARGCTVLQMACRSGKTAVAAGLVRVRLEAGGAVLVLVPGLALLRQTAVKLAAYGLAAAVQLVGSDPEPVELPGLGRAVMTTDGGAIRAFLARPGAKLVVSTYQSSPLVPTDAFGLTVFDECHRVCGGGEPRPFNHTLLAPRQGERLFMSATPVFDRVAITMKDRERFGGVAFRYYLRQGIAAGFVNDFRLALVAAPAPLAGPAEAGAAEEAALPDQIDAAMAQVDKLLVFCRNIAHVTRLAAALQPRGAPGLRAGPAAPPYAVYVAHSRLGAGAAEAALAAFAAPGRAALLNVRMFQEGVEVPALNGVFFAAPRSSPRDIIQIVCRPLNRQPGKPPSAVFLPVLTDPGRAPEDPANLRRFAALIPFVDALLDEDPRLYEHLLDPAATPYPLALVGSRALGLAPAAAEALLAAARRGVRYAGSARRPLDRLTKPEAVPWETAFAEIRRVVERLDRYPKTVDRLVIGTAQANLHAIYKHWAARYQRWAAGDLDALEPFQARALAGLKGWVPFGTEGPYPWRFCLAALERHLAATGEVPMLELNVGGYVGLEATELERLSGMATCINQADGRDRVGRLPGNGFTLAPEKAADLDRLCGRYGLTWRKARDARGVLDPCSPKTCFQAAHARFKAHYRAHGAESDWIQRHFPGYPAKHRRQEAAKTETSALPPRKPGRRRWPAAAGRPAPVRGVNADSGRARPVAPARSAGRARPPAQTPTQTSARAPGPPSSHDKKNGAGPRPAGT